MTSSDWLPTRASSAKCNCGIVVTVDDRRLAIRKQAHPGVCGLHLQQGVAAGPYRTTGLA